MLHLRNAFLRNETVIRRTGANELIVTAQIFDHAKRLRSFEILAEARDDLAKAA